MFICEKCHGPSYKIFRSYGRCEVCGKTKPCLETRFKSEGRDFEKEFKEWNDKQ